MTDKSNVSNELVTTDSRPSLQGVWNIRLKIGGTDFYVDSTNMISLTVYEYLDRLLPTFCLELQDPGEVMIKTLPLDSMMSKVSLTFSNPIFEAVGDRNMEFKVYRRFPMSVPAAMSAIRFTGVLDVKDCLSPCHQTGWVNKTLATIIREITSDMGCEMHPGTDLGNKPMSVVQPNWNNAMFLRYLASKWAVSATGKVGFYCYISADRKGTPRLYFRTLTELFSQRPKFRFMTTKEYTPGLFPIYNFESYDNFNVLNALGTRTYTYRYFDYEAGKMETKQLSIQDGRGISSLAEYYSVDQDIEDMDNEVYFVVDKTVDADKMDNIHRGRLFDRINSLNKTWISTTGVQSIRCGDIVTIMPEERPPYFAVQYSGHWLVERVIHHFSNSYTTKLLLTRSGVDAMSGSALEKADTYKQTANV